MTSTCVCIYIYTVIDTFYIALFWVLKALYIEGWNLFNHHQCAASTWIMRQQPYCATTLTTHQLGVEGQFFSSIFHILYSEAIFVIIDIPYLTVSISPIFTEITIWQAALRWLKLCGRRLSRHFQPLQEKLVTSNPWFLEYCRSQWHKFIQIPQKGWSSI